MFRNDLRAAFLAIVTAASLFTNRAGAVNPNPLESAYWRFEEGIASQLVTPQNADVVLDWINNNKMRAFKNDVVNAAPSYTSAVAAKPLRSGLPNALALDFVPNRDIYADTQNIDNGTILPGGGFTMEAAFFTRNPNRWGAIVAKEGAVPGGGGLPTFALKTSLGTSHLRVQQFDAAGILVNVDSLQPLVAQQWYYTAVVNDGSQLSLWLDSGAGYELQGSVPVDGALYQGPKLLADFNGDLKVDGADYVMWRENFGSDQEKYNQWRAEFGSKNDWLHNWSIGRGEFNSAPNDWFDGIIDEVRLSNTALAPSQFLFASPGGGGALGSGSVPEPVSVMLVLFGILGLRFGRRRREFR